MLLLNILRNLYSFYSVFKKSEMPINFQTEIPLLNGSLEKLLTAMKAQRNSLYPTKPYRSPTHCSRRWHLPPLVRIKLNVDGGLPQALLQVPLSVLWFK